MADIVSTSLQDQCNEQKPKRLLPIDEVVRQTGFGTSFIYDKIKKGEFPPPVKVGISSRWIESQVQNWIEKHISGRGLICFLIKNILMKC